MSAKRRLKKMQRQRRVAGRGPRPPESGDDSKLDDPDYLDDLKALAELDDLDDTDDFDDLAIVRYDPVTGVATAVSGQLPGGIPFSNMVAHLIRNDGLALDQLPAGTFAKMLRDHACPTVAKNDAMTLRDGCQAWYRWPVGNGTYIDLKLYQAQGRLQLPESLQSHAEVVAVMDAIIFEHYIQQPAITRTLHERGAEAATDLVEAIPIHLHVEEGH